MHTNLHAHVPFTRLTEHLDYIISSRINPEIFFTAEALDHMVPEELSALASVLNQAGLFCTFHAPFLDLNPGALDPLVREVTEKRVAETFLAAEHFNPRAIVFHPGYDDLRYGGSRLDWLKHSIDFWGKFVPKAETIGCTIAMENIFEKEPSTLLALLEAIDSPRFRHCFDVGHWHMFSNCSLEEWFSQLGGFIAECHLHDNGGTADEHLPPGEGNIDFDVLFNLLRQNAPSCILTIEAHTLERLERARTALNLHLPFP